MKQFTSCFLCRKPITEAIKLWETKTLRRKLEVHPDCFESPRYAKNIKIAEAAEVEYKNADRPENSNSILQLSACNGNTNCELQKLQS
jgi:hypothetical protein